MLSPVRRGEDGDPKEKAGIYNATLGDFSTDKFK